MSDDPPLRSLRADPVQLPVLAGPEAELWPILMALARTLPATAWALIGGQMVALHGFAAGRSPVRFSEDLDILANMATRAGNLAACVRAVQHLGFTAAPAATPGITHRYGRGEMVIDLVAPDHLPPTMRLTTTPPDRTVQVAGAGRPCSESG